MANPFAYGDVLSLDTTKLSNASLILKQWSVDVLRYGRDKLVFANFLNSKTELGKGKGQTIQVPIYGEVPTLGTSALTEGTSIPVATVALDSVSVTIDEYGNAIAKPAEIDYFSNINHTVELIESLGWNFAKSWDAVAKTVFDSAVHGVRTVGTAGSYSIGSNLGNKNGDGTLTDEIVEAVYDHLTQQKVPKFGDGLYRWVLNNKQSRQIQRLADFKNLYTYQLGGRAIFSQVIGQYKGFLFIETEENMPSGTAIGYAFGPNVGVMAFGLPMEIRHEPDFKQDFQRLQAFAWYLIGGVAAALRDKGTHLLVVKSGVS